MSQNDQNEPVVEHPPQQGSAAFGEDALQSRIRQQGILADLGVLALKGAPFEDLLHETVRLSVEGLSADFGKVLEHLPAEDRLIMRAGSAGKRGWSAKPPLEQTLPLPEDLRSAPASP